MLQTYCLYKDYKSRHAYLWYGLKVVLVTLKISVSFVFWMHTYCFEKVFVQFSSVFFFQSKLCIQCIHRHKRPSEICTNRLMKCSYY